MLIDKLIKQKTEGTMVAFSHWPDGEGILVGYVLEITASSARFALVSQLGLPDKELEVSFDSINRLAAAPKYMERLRMFAAIVPPIEEAKGQLTRSQAAIKRRLREAASTGECIYATLLGAEPGDYKVLRVDREFCELEEYADDPLHAIDVILVRHGQIEKLRWRSSGELAVTALWKTQSVD